MSIPNVVMEDAAQAMMRVVDNCGMETSRAAFVESALRAVAPVLLAPEVAKREMVERRLAYIDRVAEEDKVEWRVKLAAVNAERDALLKAVDIETGALILGYIADIRVLKEELHDLEQRYEGEIALNAGIAGNFRCDKCEFVLQKSTLNPDTGALGVFPLHKLEDCPNGCGSMRSSTWRDLCLDARKACDAFTERMLSAEARLSEEKR